MHRYATPAVGRLVAATALIALATVPSAGAHSAARPDVGKEQALYHFKGRANGASPLGGLLADSAGALYGTTSSGGDGRCARGGCGTVFKLTPAGTRYAQTVIYRFHGAPKDGAMPAYVTLIADAAGSLYGTTAAGGSASCPGVSGCGTVFRLTPSASGYSESILYSFRGGSDGWDPQTGLLANSTGTLFGTTVIGGTGCGASGCGTIFELTPSRSGYAERILYRFKGSSDGYLPYSNLIADASGALYGTTYAGGLASCSQPSGSGSCGTVYRLSPSRGRYRERILYRFQGTPDGADPIAGLLSDGAGSLYGTTTQGGGSNGVSCGTAFKLARGGAAYHETVIHSFDCDDGEEPNGGLIADPAGVLYGTTPYGGRGPCPVSSGSSGCGEVFKLTPVGAGYRASIVYNFRGDRDGALPLGVLIRDASGALYGTTSNQDFLAASGLGTVFRIKP